MDFVLKMMDIVLTIMDSMMKETDFPDYLIFTVLGVGVLQL